MYKKYLKSNPFVILPMKEKKNTKHVYHLFVIKVNNRKKLIEFLNKNKVQTNIHYPKILSDVPAFNKRHKQSLVPYAKKNSNY